MFNIFNGKSKTIYRHRMRFILQNSSPHFPKENDSLRLNKLRGRLYRYPNPTRKGIMNIVDVLKKYKFPATFCICGHLYLKECSGWDKISHPIKPKNLWFSDKIGEDWYYWDKGGDYNSHPNIFLGDFIEKEMKKVPFFKFGLHSFSHEALTLEDEDTIDSIIKKGIFAAKKLGIKIESFGAPFEMISDVKDKEKILKILAKNNIKETQYAGLDEGFRILRKMDFKKPELKSKLKLFYISKYIECTTSRRELLDLLKDLSKIRDEERVYVIATHDFTWKDKNKFDFFIKNLKEIIRR